MKPILLFLALASLVAAQAVPGRYIVEFQAEPAAATAARTRLGAASGEVRARRGQILNEHRQAETAIRGLGGTITHHYTTVLNGMAVTMNEGAVAQLRRTPGVRGVYPVMRHHAVLDHAVNVHRMTQAWQTLSGGQGSAGAGIKIGIFDSGIDISHPAFHGFSTAIPDGFPLVSSNTETANTNNKVIVSRVYSDPGYIDNQTGVDLFGHGTSVAAIAAGLTNDPGVPGIRPLTGAAPGAWLGNYKVADDNGGSDDVTFLAALEDALNDGMNVVNYSYGGPVLNSSDENGPDARAIAAAAAAGMLVVVSAGNSGPDPSTITAPAVVPATIAVGSNENERFFWYAVTLPNGPSFFGSVPDAEFSYTGQVAGPLVDVTAIDDDGFACNAMPPDSLKGQIALIQRGPLTGACTFDTKLNNAANAGPQGAVIYDNRDERLCDYTVDMFADGTLFVPSLSTATLSAMFVSQQDGLSLLSNIQSNPGIQVTLDFDGFTSLPRPSNVVTDYSSGGPTPGANVKPDLLAVGDWFVTANTTQNNPLIPYVLEGGTSLAAPLVTGAFAVLMAQRPGLTGAQYRSLIINSAPELDQYTDGSVAPPQVGGTGVLDLVGALQNNLAATPTSVNFPKAAAPSGPSSADSDPDSGAGGVNTAQMLTFTNVGSASDTFTVVVKPLNASGPVASVDVSTFTLDPGASQQVSVQMNGSNVAPGQYHGFLTVTGTKGSAATRVAYWLGVPDTTIVNIGILDAPYSSSPGSTETITFRCLDMIGTPLVPAADPVVTTQSPRAQVLEVRPEGDIPGTFSVDVQLGRADANGQNVFTISAGNATKVVAVGLQ